MLTRNIRSEVIEKNLYHDTQRGAAVMVSDTDGLRVEGMIGDRLRISPSNTAERSAAGHLAHEIFEIKIQSSEGNDISPEPPNRHLVSTNASKHFDITAMERARRGYAYVGGACRETRVGMVEDKAMFTGTHTFVHEVGHLLGMSHDGDIAPYHIQNSPGVTKCSPSDGYIMAPSYDVHSYHLFSVCSAEQLFAFR
ncbi:hypothetical protein IscW_ISCW008756, partial [Ixodes scapularis]